MHRRHAVMGAGAREAVRTVRRTTSDTMALARSTLLAPIVYAIVKAPMSPVTKRPPHAKATTSCHAAAPPLAEAMPADTAEAPNC